MRSASNKIAFRILTSIWVRTASAICDSIGAVAVLIAMPKLRMHHIYYALAAFDIMAVGLGLYLSHRTADALQQTVELNTRWSAVHDRVAELRAKASSINAPGNDVFESADPDLETRRFETAAREFAPALNAIKREISVIGSEALAEAGQSLEAVSASMDRMVAQTRKLLFLYAAGDIVSASAEMAAMDRSYSIALGRIDESSRRLRNVEAGENGRKVELVRSHRAAEMLLAIVLVAMVAAVAVYGHQMGRLMQSNHDALENSHSRLEQQVADRTRHLERARESISELNRQLEANVAELSAVNARLKQQDHVLRSQNEMFQCTLQHMPHGVAWFARTGHLVICNERYRLMYDLPEDVAVPGTCREAIARYGVGIEDSADGLDRRDDAEDVRMSTLDDGRSIVISKTHMPAGGFLETHTDITDRRRLEEQVAHQANHDSLTGLHNRRGFQIELDYAIDRMVRGDKFALLCLDLDHFKQVNDTLGHPIGDRLLKEVSERLQACIRKTDTIARIGGDEFAIVQVLAEQPDGSAALAERIIAEVGRPYLIDGHQIVVGTSIGIVLAPADGTTAEVLHKNADLALYRAKNDGRGTFRLYEPEMDTKMRARRLLELDLRQALKLDQFELEYQPLIEVESRTVKGFEALLRWRHPDRGMVSPMAFIPLAEEIGLMGALGSWILKKACLEAASWSRAVRVAVNISPAQFRDRSLELDVFDALEASGLDASRLELEITESVLLANTEHTLRVLAKLRERGVRIALDDFGTGYSSLSYLRNFPFDKVKIDRSFTQSTTEKADSALAIVRAVIGLSGELGMSTTAEGVETDEQLDLLRTEGCTEVQGYLFSKPVHASKVEALLSSYDCIERETAVLPSPEPAVAQPVARYAAPRA